jgi:endonuclease YncB( thermonuclease family)
MSLRLKKFLSKLCTANFLLISLSGQASAETIEVSRVVSVYDGDTIKVDIDSWPEIVARAYQLGSGGRYSRDTGENVTVRKL